MSTSVEEVGLYGPSLEKAWIRTGTESLHLWEWAKACQEEAAGGDTPFAEWGDARGAVGALMGATPLAAAFEEVRICMCAQHGTAVSRSQPVMAKRACVCVCLHVCVFAHRLKGYGSKQYIGAGIATHACMECMCPCAYAPTLTPDVSPHHFM